MSSFARELVKIFQFTYRTVIYAPQRLSKTDELIHKTKRAIQLPNNRFFEKVEIVAVGICSAQYSSALLFFNTQNNHSFAMKKKSQYLPSIEQLIFSNEKHNRMMLCFWFLIVILTIPVEARTCPSRSSIGQLLIDAHIPGAVILVVNATDILYEQTFGYHSLLPLRSMDANRSIFALASLSKTFIAVAVMQLVESHVLDLDADINQYLSVPLQRIFHPLYPSHSITLRQLLSHSASIKRNDQMEATLTDIGDRALTPAALVNACYTYLNPNASNWLSYPPGSVTMYSNIGSSLAALVVERETRVPYDTYVKEKILRPLGIDKSGFRLSDFINAEDLVKHYTFNASRLDLLNQRFPQLNLARVNPYRFQ